MSGKITGIVWESALKQNDKYVLLAYADHADHEGNGIFPSINLIAWKTGYSDRNIKRIKKNLIKKGYLVETGIRSSGTPVYRIDTEALPKLPSRGDKLSPQKQDEEGDNLSPCEQNPPIGVTNCPKGGDSIVSPEPSKNRHINNNGAKKQPPHQPIYNSLAELYKIDLELITDKLRVQLYKEAKKLLRAKKSPDDVKSFGVWWYHHDWRGKQDQPPAPFQASEMWGRFEESRKKNSKGLGAK